MKNIKDENLIFISHASPDKRGPVKLLAQALAYEGVHLFIDGPGRHDDTCMGFSAGFISKYNIRSISIGCDWDDEIKKALRDAKAVLLCISKTALILQHRKILEQEVTYADISDKLVTCVIDDTAIDEIKATWGLVSLHMKQTVRIDINCLCRALKWLEEDKSRTPIQLPEALQPVWESIRAVKNACFAKRAVNLRTDLDLAATELYGLIAEANLSPNWIKRAFRCSLPDEHRAAAAEASLGGILRNLVDSKPIRKDLPSPIFGFAERLGRKDRPEILHWVDNQCVDKLMRDALRKYIDREDQIESDCATVFIDIDDVANRLTWWIKNKKPELCFRETEIKLNSTDINTLSSILCELLNEANQLVGDRVNYISVALLLSHHQLSNRIIDIPILLPDPDGLGGNPEPLCRRYAVTLHWRNRALKKSGSPAIIAWKRAARILQERSADHGGVEVMWAVSEISSVSQISKNILSQNGQGVCVGIDGERGLSESITQGLKEGLPYMIWFRSTSHDSAMRNHKINEKFGEFNVTDAHLHISEICRKASSGEPFEYLSILWDIPL